MTAITLIAEPFPDWQAETHAAAIRDLTRAIAATAPRSCSARYLVARGSTVPEFASPLIRVDHLPMKASSLPFMWRNGPAARPLDGEFVHAHTPLVPLRSHGEDDGSQSSVMIPHALAWEAPELLGAARSRQFRGYTRRAVRLADVVLTPTHATARVIREHYGDDLPVQVLQLAPPSEYLQPADHLERRAAFGLPSDYALTTAMPGDHGRLEWVLDAMRADPALPSLVVLEGVDPVVVTKSKEPADPAAAVTAAIPPEIAQRVTVVRPRDLTDIGAVISGASLLLQPQAFADTGYTVLAALRANVPVLHAGRPATAETVLDAGASAESAQDFSLELSRLFREERALETLAVLARDRSRGFSWESAAWQLWETHANL
ncbi:MAG: mannosyltransferase [Leucobacter sp.]